MNEVMLFRRGKKTSYCKEEYILVIFETILALLLGAALLSMFAGKIGIPYPTLLALGGVFLAITPGMPSLDLAPDLILALFVAPVLLDAAHDTSLRDLKRNWAPIFSLVVVAVGLTTIVVAVAVRFFLPDMPWAAAIALGALLAPPDAVAALAVMKSISPPHRIRAVLEGESLLNDASSLLIYSLAVTAVLHGSFSASDILPAFLLVSVASVVAGWVLARLIGRLTALIREPATATIVQVVTTFGIWILAEKFGLSSVITIVSFGITAGRKASEVSPAEVRVKSFAAWEALTMVLNVLAFTMIGLQLRPIADSLTAEQLRVYPLYALAILFITIAIRMTWVLFHGTASRLISGDADDLLGTWGGTFKSGVVVGWAGMRGIVTVAAALALPTNFPHKEFILLVAFIVVLGTLLVQGLTLKPLLKILRFPPDTVVAGEVKIARAAVVRAALQTLESDQSPAAKRLQQEFSDALEAVDTKEDLRQTPENLLRKQMMPACRRAIDKLRDEDTIGDEAYRILEAELDRFELSAASD
jgi:CPA1 family monovalent cation:H+ antiporter